MKVIKSLITNNRCYKNGATRKPIGIQIHSIGTAQGTAKAVVDYWNQSSVSMAVTYICDADEAGRVYQMLPEEYYTWADGGYGNRNLITIEIAESDWMKYRPNSASYDITNRSLFEADIRRGYATAVELCADICKRYGWDPMSKLPSGLYLISSHDEGRKAGLSTAHVDPSHIWPPLGLSMDTFRQAVKNAIAGKKTSATSTTQATTASSTKWYRVRKTWADEKSQLGAFEKLANAKAACPAGYSVFDSNGKAVYTNQKAVTVSGTQAAEFQGLSEGKAAEKILELVRTNDDSGILYSVTAAQMILESGYVTTNLAKIANNVFGMKATLSGNTWESAWDGISKVTIPTKEWSSSKGWYTIDDVFRAYGCLEDSVKDHSAYLLGAKNGSKYRYEGLLDAPTYREAITIIKNGGYATDPSYVDKICNIIQRFSLDRYDGYIFVTGDKEMNATVKKAVDWALATAKDNSHGYDNTKGKRTGPDYACSSFVAAAWRAAGLASIPANAYTATMRKYFLAAGFMDVSSAVDLKTGQNMIAGDVVLNPGKHVEMVINSKHQLVGARGNATGGAENGKKGDQTGKEIAVTNWYDYGWRFCLRYSKEETKKEPVKYYRVQVGFYKMKGNAVKKQNTMKTAGYETVIVERNGGYSVCTKTKYKTAETATKGANTLIKKGIAATIVLV